MTASDADGGAAGPADAFTIIGNETRIEILRALGEDPYSEASFSTLRDHVDPEMDSGQFNYHLSKLCEQFVDRNDGGYTLRPEGIALYRQLRAGTFTRRVSHEEFDAGFDCHFCGMGVTATYRDGLLEMVCGECAYQYLQVPLPPSALEDTDPQEALALIDQYLRHRTLALSRGVCPLCANAIEVDLVPAEDLWIESLQRLRVFVSYTCDHCGHEHYVTIGHSLLYEPALVAFFHRHGTDITREPHWELGFTVTDDAVTVLDTDPWAVTLSITRDGETLAITVDDEASVVDVQVES